MSENVKKLKKRVKCEPHSVSYTSSTFAPDQDTQEDWRTAAKIKVLRLNKQEIQFELIGVDAPIANALRRMILSDVPTMAVDKVIVVNNTSVMQDEVLAHRIGLIPIIADADKFQMISETGDKPKQIIFRLSATCPQSKDRLVVKSGDLQWIPKDDKAVFGSEGPEPVHKDIPIIKLARGQSIDLQIACYKNVGREHAKWMPAATASYRLMPDIRFREEIRDADADKLKEMCPMGVFDIEDIGKHRRATVKKPRNCSMCRECVRHEGWADRIDLGRIKDHFIFSVETTGVMPPETIVTKALELLMSKVQTVDENLDSLQ